MNRNERVVIVGGGPASLSAARAYREAGGEASVTLLTAEAFAPYQRPPLTKEYLRGESARDDLWMQPEEWFEENGVELRRATVVRSVDRDRRVVEAGGEEFPYDACVLATGSEPMRLPVPGGDHPEILVMRTLENSDRLRSRVGPGDRVVVVGSGFIGCEAAASLSMRGADVAVISIEDLPQGERLGRETGERIRGWLEGYGVTLRLGTEIEEIERDDGGFVVWTRHGDTWPADTVLFGTGVSPRVGLAEEAGLAVKDGGVVTDSSMRTSAPGVYAAGDIARAYNESAGRHLGVEHWGDALEHGRIAGTVIAGGEASWDMVPGFWSTIGDKTLKYWAWGERWDDLRFVDRRDSFTVWYGKDGVLVGVLEHGSDEDYKEGQRLIASGAPFAR